MISIYNEQLHKWEIKNDIMENTEELKNALNKAGLPSASEFRKFAYVPRETTEELKQLKTTHVHAKITEEYKELRAEALPHCFSKAFLEAVKLKPIHNAVYTMLGQGESPYKLVEWLADEVYRLQNELGSLNTGNNY